MELLSVLLGAVTELLVSASTQPAVSEDCEVKGQPELRPHASGEEFLLFNVVLKAGSVS